jgi:hypothetical protein
MGQNNSTALSSYEAENPLQRLSEARISRIRVLHVTSENVANLLSVKRINLAELVIKCDLRQETQLALAKCVWHLSQLKSVTIENTGRFICEQLMSALFLSRSVVHITLQQHEFTSEECRLLSKYLSHEQVSSKLSTFSIIDCVFPHGVNLATMLAVLPATCIVVTKNVIHHG